MKSFFEKSIFLFPFIFNGLNIQGWLSESISSNLGKAFAYFNVLLIFLGIILYAKKSGEFSKTARFWIFYYVIYYTLSIIASVVHDNSLKIFSTIVSIVYFFGFYSFLRFRENRKLFEITVCAVFTIANIVLIIFSELNFDYDFYKRGIELNYELDRAQGVYGDANNAAAVCILGFAFLTKLYKTPNLLHKIIKLILVGTTLYALFLTFSTTGFGIFFVVFIILNHKLFTKRGILFLLIALPLTYVVLLNLTVLTKGLNLNIRQQHKIQNVVNIVSLDFENVDSSGRDIHINEALEYLYENPFFGNGLSFGNNQSTHNTFLNVWLDAGIFCLLLFLVLLGSYFTRAMQLPLEKRSFVLAILITLCGFMLSLQSIVNQPYLITLFVYMGYMIDTATKKYTVPIYSS